MGVVLVELGLGVVVGQAVEVGEEIHLRALSPGPFPACERGEVALQVVDQHLGVNLFLNVERRCVNNQIRPVLLILATPDKLWVEVAVAALVGHADGSQLFLLHDRLVFGSGYVLARRLVVLEGFDGEF